MKIVIDGQAVELPGGGSGGGGSGAEEVYSTEETRIGTWIDGKPLYRKIYTGSVKTKPNHAPVEKIVPDWFLGAKLVRLYGNAYIDTGAYGVYVQPLGQHIDENKNAWGNATHQKDDDLRIVAYWNIALTQELEIVTEYTKNEEGAG